MDSLSDRFWSKVDKTEGCWLWTGARSGKGYGYFYIAGKVCLAHRVAFEMIVGPIPEGLQLDHVAERGCQHKHCVNPAHLEPVTNAENHRRAPRARRTHCANGHPFDAENTYHWPADPFRTRRCRACGRARRAAAA